MIATSYKTKKVVPGDSLEEILSESLPQLKENSVVIITSKIVGICEGRVVKNDGSVTKDQLIRQEAEQLLVNEEFYKNTATFLTITNNILAPSAGIDESNGNGYFILWPKNPIQSATKIWNFLREKYKVKNVGVVIVDSYFTPLRRGSIGVALGWCGFVPLNNYIGKPDIFGEPMKYTVESMVDTLASVGTIMLGEGQEQTPLAVIEEIPDITFVDRCPSKEETKVIKHTPVDMFVPMIHAAKWEKGEGKSTEEL